jgi:hypothetical protein
MLMSIAALVAAAVLGVINTGMVILLYLFLSLKRLCRSVNHGKCPAPLINARIIP